MRGQARGSELQKPSQVRMVYPESAKPQKMRIFKEAYVISPAGDQLRTESCSVEEVCAAVGPNAPPNRAKSLGFSPSRRRAPEDQSVKRAIIEA